MIRARKVALGAAILLLVGWLVTHLVWKNSTSPFSEKTRQRFRTVLAAKPVEDEASNTDFDVPRQSIEDDWTGLLKWLESSPPPTEDEFRSRLSAIRLAWTQMDPQERARAVSDILASGIDAATGLDFKVGPHGALSGWPTLRVFLLDILATSDPEMARATAGQVLDTTASADEFATALKSLTRDSLGQATDTELHARFDQMLGHSDWQTSRGFAEAFDLARFIGTSEAAQSLATWDGNPALKAMAMDEFAAEHPEAMMEVLKFESAVSGAPRANIMARADPSIPPQLDSVDAYLRRPDLPATEITTFLQSFPLRSVTTGYRLYGETPSPYTLDQIKTGDLAARDLVVGWIADPALEKFRPELISLQTRLTQWIQQAE